LLSHALEEVTMDRRTLARLQALMACAVVLARVSSTPASDIPGMSIEGGVAQVATTTGPGMTQGWEFKVNQPIRITALGIFDAGNANDSDPADGLLIDHDLGLYRMDSAASATLLESVTAKNLFYHPNPTFLVGNWRYMPISPIELEVGESYAVATYYPDVPTYSDDPIPNLITDYVFGDEIRRPNV
jgi:hypothetical protein